MALLQCEKLSFSVLNEQKTLAGNLEKNYILISPLDYIVNVASEFQTVKSVLKPQLVREGMESTHINKVRIESLL